MGDNWVQIKDVVFPLDEVGGVVLAELKNGAETVGYRLLVMVTLGQIPIYYEPSERNEARADLTMLKERLNRLPC